MSKNNGKRYTFRLHPAAWILIIGTFLARAGFFMTIPYLGIYLHEVKQMPPSSIGAILAVSFVVSTFSGFIGGALSDRFGRYPIMIGSLLLWGAVFIGFNIADPSWLFIILNGLNGFCRSTFETAAKALLTDVTTGNERQSAFQLRYLAINVGAAVGPLAGLQIGSSHSGIAFILTGSLYFALSVILSGFRLLEQSKSDNVPENMQAEKVHFKEVISILMKDKVFRFLVISNFFIYSGYGHIDTTLSQYLGENQVGLYSLLFIVNGLAVLLLQYPIMRWTKKLSNMMKIKTGTLCFGFALAGFGFFHHIPMLIICMILFSAGEIFCFIIGDLVIGDIAPESMRGTYFGASGLAFLGQSMGAWAGGLLLGGFGYHQGGVVFTILASLTLLALPALYLCDHIMAKNEHPQLAQRKSHAS